MEALRTEYPRPDFRRSAESFVCLNGEWSFRIGEGNDHPLKINVPFAPESELSGICRTGFMKEVSYEREFEVKKEEGRRILLRFGAVDYIARVYINSAFVGYHRGGYTPFFFDIGGFVSDGKNTLTVDVFDDTRDPSQPSGKQSPEEENRGCFYTRSTGIWQTVWLEYVEDTYIENAKITPDAVNGNVYLRVNANQNASGLTLCAHVLLDGNDICEGSAIFSGRTALLALNVRDLKYWDIGSPVLYDLKLELGNDSVDTYFGFRTIETKGNRVLLNGRSVFQRLVLDQGYYPDGIYTAKDVFEIEDDIRLAMEAGFNGARLHMKVFEPYAAYYADRIGYLLWCEYPSWGLDDSQRFVLDSMLGEWVEAVVRDCNHPSVIGWCPFNETGLKRNENAFRALRSVTKEIDPHRLYIDTSGYVHSSGLADVYDVHNYEPEPEKFALDMESVTEIPESGRINFPDEDCGREGQPYFVSEYGGLLWDIDGTDGSGWGYGSSVDSIGSAYERMDGLTREMLTNPNICGFCYTQLTDVMQEKNGIYTFSRKRKFDSEKLRSIFSAPAEIEKTDR